MPNKIPTPVIFLFAIILIVGLACSLPGVGLQTAPTTTPQQAVQVVEVTATLPQPTETLFSGESNLPELPTATSTPVITHIDYPVNSVDLGAIVYDVQSSDTAPEKRAPYGDSYDIYRMERPFTQDMTYIPDMDIATYNVMMTEDWVYVSLELIGTNPNNEIGIHYGVELDLDGDGFGDYLIWSNPPYTSEWSTDGVQVFADKNHDTGGLSAELSDAPLDGDGYETQVFDSGIGDDSDLAWIRAYSSRQATIQFAFKKSMAGSSFLLGVLSDAGLKDVTQMYYNDRFTEVEAGSPEKSEKYYPLKALYAFDNVCREAFNFKVNGYEPLLCPRDEPKPGRTDTGGCENPSQYTDSGSCTAAGCAWRLNPGIFTHAVYYCTYP
jgi:hypothetical protein